MTKVTVHFVNGHRKEYIAQNELSNIYEYLENFLLFTQNDGDQETDFVIPLTSILYFTLKEIKTDED